MQMKKRAIIVDQDLAAGGHYARLRKTLQDAGFDLEPMTNPFDFEEEPRLKAPSSLERNLLDGTIVVEQG